jgi:hypothetical protein
MIAKVVGQNVSGSLDDVLSTTVLKGFTMAGQALGVNSLVSSNVSEVLSNVSSSMQSWRG